MSSLPGDVERRSSRRSAANGAVLLRAVSGDTRRARGCSLLLARRCSCKMRAPELLNSSIHSTQTAAASGSLRAD